MVQCKSLSSNLVEGELEPWDVCRATKSLFPVLRIHHSRTCSPKLFYSLHYFLRHLHVIFHIYLVKYNSYPFVVLCFFFAMVLLPVTDQYWGQYCRMVQWDLGWGPLCGSFLLPRSSFSSFPILSHQPLIVVPAVPPFLCYSVDIHRVTELVWVMWAVVPAAAWTV